MTYTLDALQDRPLGLFQMDDSTPFTDYSGYDRVATATANAGSTVSLIKGASYGQVLHNTAVASFASPVFKQGSEAEPFTIGAWVKVVSPSGFSEQQVLGSPGQMDGLVINGNQISFVTKYLTAPEARCTYDLQTRRAVAVWGIHTKDKNMLYVNGVMVSEVNLTEEQQDDSFIATGTSLSSGASSGTQRISVNGVAFYPYALSAESILRQYNSGKDTPSIESISDTFSGDTLPVSTEVSKVFLNQWWQTEDDWTQAQLLNVAVLDSKLVPQFEEDTSVSGEWRDSFAIDSANSTSIYGVVFNWDGEGAVVKVSLDGTSWETVSRGVKVTTIPTGFNPTDTVLQISVSFPGGIVNDTSYLDSLNAVGLLSNVSEVVQGRTITYNNATPEGEFRPMDHNDNFGVEIPTGGSIVVSADAAEATPMRTIEIWLKRTSASTNPTFSAAGATIYQNGVNAGGTFTHDHWTLVHVVATADITGTFTITGPGQVGRVTVYDTALTATQITNIYNAYMGTNAVRVADASVINISEPATAATIYAHDWTIQGAG